MTRIYGNVRQILMLMLLGAVTASGCSKSDKASAPKSAAPAKVEKQSESDLAIVTLTAKAVERLGITISQAETQQIPRVRRFGGEIVVPPGNRVIVSAPLPGTLSLPEGAHMPTPGERVNAGDIIFQFTPLLPPERQVPSPVERIQIASARASLISMQITAEGEVKRGRAEVEGAEISLNRAENLLQDRAGSARAVDDAKAQLQIAQKTLEAAVERATLLQKLTLDSEQGTLETIPIAIPASGTLQAMNVSRGQTVAVGQPLFEVADLNTVWVKVPVYVGQLQHLRPDADAVISDLSADARSDSLTAKPVAAPPTANALSSTADIYFELSNEGGLLRPGQRVSVALPESGDTETLTVPAGAVLYDIFGGTWVYVQDGEGVFHRERIVIDHMTSTVAAIRTGPAPGTYVVVDGAAELFGTEFGTGK